ncbi:MAG TPA: amidohydrolase family protein [bacterium]|nr:amidohydrolase family protein [bacterium]
MPSRLVLFAKTLLTMDRARPLEDGFVLVEGSRILQVGRRRDYRPAPSKATRVLDLGATILLPGLINAHCHLDFTAFKGKVPFKGNFREWLREMAGRTRAFTPHDFQGSVRAGIRESLAYGTTTICDISTSGESFRQLPKSGLRAFAFLELLDVAQPDTQAVWKRFQQRLKSLLAESPEAETFRWGISPHTPFTVSKELLILAGRYAASHRACPTTIHVAESRDEARFFKTGRGAMAKRMKALNPDWTLPHGTTPVQYLNDCGWLPKLDLAVHVNRADDRDIRLLARNRVSVAHCPGSHAFFDHSSFPYARLRQKGVRVCLGTDSLASNRSLSMFREMRLFGLRHPSVPPEEILAMATVKPAQALGEGRLGRIKPGYFADLIGIPAGRKDPYGQVLGHSKPVTFSMIHGHLRLR